LTIAALHVWDIENAYSLEKLQKLQNRAARVITGKLYDVRSKDILEELSWQPLMERWGNNKAIFMHKVTNGEYLDGEY
jgi:L-2-hydroxyglutarate oxidase LhgO